MPARAFPVWAGATSVFAIVMMCVTPSFAQKDPIPVTSPVQWDVGIAKQGPDNAPNADELGIALGSFRLYPRLDLLAGYDSNVFAQPVRQQVSSSYEAERRSVDLRSDWSNHMLNLSAEARSAFTTTLSHRTTRTSVFRQTAGSISSAILDDDGKDRTDGSGVAQGAPQAPAHPLMASRDAP